MSRVTTPPSVALPVEGAARAGRLGTAAAWISAVCCLPYLVLKVVWTLGIPVGIDDRSVLDENAWVAGNALMAVVQLVGLVLVIALTRAWARRVPVWLLLFPAWVGTGLLFQVAVGAGLVALFSASSGGSGDLGGIQPWVFVMVYSAFAGQGVALAIAFGCHARARWGRLLARRTGDVVADRSVQPRAEHLVTASAQAVAGMAVAVALVSWYWAAGGTLGLSGAHSEDSWALHLTRGTGGVIAAAGLLGLAGRWGRRTRFWVPVGLAWIGSGALAAFDGLNLVLNALFAGLGAGASDHEWVLTDTVLALKVATGGLAGAVGILAVLAAARAGPRGDAVHTGENPRAGSTGSGPT